MLFYCSREQQTSSALDDPAAFHDLEQPIRQRGSDDESGAVPAFWQQYSTVSPFPNVIPLVDTLILVDSLRIVAAVMITTLWSHR